LYCVVVRCRYWLVNCSPEAVAENPDVGQQLADQLYPEVMAVPYMAKFIVFAKRRDEKHGLLRVFVVTDDKLDKTLESYQRFLEVARSDEVEVRFQSLGRLRGAVVKVKVTCIYVAPSREMSKVLRHRSHTVLPANYTMPAFTS